MSLELKQAIADIEEKTNQKMLSLRRAHNGILKGGRRNAKKKFTFQVPLTKFKEKHIQLQQEYNRLLKENQKLSTHIKSLEQSNKKNANDYYFQAFNICEKEYKKLEQKYNVLLKENQELLTHNQSLKQSNNDIVKEKNALKNKYHDECLKECRKACDAKIETVKSLLKQEYDALCNKKIETVEKEKTAIVQEMKNTYLNLIKDLDGVYGN